MRRSLVIPVLLAAWCVGAAFAQQRPVRNSRSFRPVQRADVDPDLWTVLEDWSEKSTGFTRLEGQVLRRTYDTTFAVEQVVRGYFYYEAPDKGRLDLDTVEINQKMLAARQKKGAKVRRKNGEPFKLETGLSEKWVCDGQRIINIEVDSKSAEVHKLPEELQGRNIMNGPLPFLFGLPPLRAVNRFTLNLIRLPSEQSPFAILKAQPKRPDDASSWQEAEVILDTRTGLPAHVRLLRPSGKQEDVYSFSSLRVNRPGGRIFEFFGRDPFRVDLRDYQVNLADRDRGAPAERPVERNSSTIDPVVPDLVGMSHEDAEAALKRLGITRKQIRKLRGNPAGDPDDVYRVQRQRPEPGEPIDAETRVALYLWTKA